jgi:hypothetical protein
MLACTKELVRLLRRIAVTVVGTVILAVGVVLLVAPGPGLMAIALALVVFGAEYQWARRQPAAVWARARSAARPTPSCSASALSAWARCSSPAGCLRLAQEPVRALPPGA